MVNALMFARIDELKEGEDFYITIMGETLAYRIDSITVILPLKATGICGFNRVKIGPP